MKGISLAIETIIVLILAVTVLTVLLVALRGVDWDYPKLVKEKEEKCSNYATQDNGKCEESPDQALIDICKKTGVARCEGNIGSGVDCARACCPIPCINKPSEAVQPV